MLTPRRPSAGAAIAALAVACALALWWVHVPGLQVVDEGAQLYQAKAIARTGGYAIGAARARFGHPAAFVPWMVDEYRGSEYARYPVLHSHLVALLLPWLGVSAGMFWNLVGLVVAVLATYALGARLESPRVGAFAAVALLGCTFLPQFGVGFWPHALGAGLVAAGTWAVVRAAEPDARHPWAWAALAGFLLTASAGARYQSILFLLVFGLLYLPAAHARPLRPLLAYAAGAAPPWAFLSYANYVRTGVPLPSTFTANAIILADLARAAAAGLGGLLAAGLCLRWSHAERESVRRPARLALRGFALLAATLPELVGGELGRFYPGLAGYLVDVRLSPYNRTWEQGETWLKSFSQSLPFVWCAAMLTPELLRDREGLRRRFPIVFCVFAAPAALALAWRDYGGFTYNMRYLAECLPCAALAAAIWLDRLATRAGVGADHVLTALATFGALGALLGERGPGAGAYLADSHAAIAVAALGLLAGVAAPLLAGDAIVGAGRRVTAARVGLGLLGAGLLAGAIHAGGDLARDLRHRGVPAEHTRLASALVRYPAAIAGSDGAVWELAPLAAAGDAWTLRARDPDASLILGRVAARERWRGLYVAPDEVGAELLANELAAPSWRRAAIEETPGRGLYRLDVSVLAEAERAGFIAERREDVGRGWHQQCSPDWAWLAARGRLRFDAVPRGMHVLYFEALTPRQERRVVVRAGDAVLAELRLVPGDHWQAIEIPVQAGGDAPVEVSFEADSCSSLVPPGTWIGAADCAPDDNGCQQMAGRALAPFARLPAMTLLTGVSDCVSIAIRGEQLRRPGPPGDLTSVLQ